MMKKRGKKAIALVISFSLMAALSACGKTTTSNQEGKTPTSANAGTEANKDGTVPVPETVNMTIDTAFGSMKEESTWAEFVKVFKERSGISLLLKKPEHNQYYDQLNLAFTSGNAPDAMEIGSVYYPTFAQNGALWDMTAAWENSELKAKGIVDEKYVEALKINGVLYGFPMTRGGGTVTYIRQDWLDNLGMKAPTNYEEFMEVLRAFTFKDPDQNGKNDTFGITAAGLTNLETPYDIYLREFYQDAKPDFYLKDGKYVDGMSEPAMVKALQRMKDAYKEGVVDKEIITNKTSTARDKFYASQVGVFNYWAGNWNVTLENNLKAATPTGKVVPLAPIAETKYIERPPLAMAITTAAKNPEGIFKYILEYSHDGGEGQLLFTRGVEGVNYEKSADGTYVQLPDPEAPDKLFEKSFYSPEMSITKFDDPIKFDERLLNSLQVLTDNSVMAPVPAISDVMTENLPSLITIKNNIIANCVTGSLSPEDAVAQYQKDGKVYIDAILADLNK